MAQVKEPTYAATATFHTFVGRYGYAACTNSEANMPMSALPRVDNWSLVTGRGASG